MRNCLIRLAGLHVRFVVGEGRARDFLLEASGVIALQEGALLLVGEDLLSHVVDHHGTFEVGYVWLSAVLLTDE